jgi:VWFA-related protein
MLEVPVEPFVERHRLGAEANRSPRFSVFVSRTVITSLIFFSTLVFVLRGHSQGNPASSESAAPVKPASQINLSSIGYQGLAGMARMASQSNISLDFVDDDHVLFTFDPKKLFTRLPECPPSHDDRLVHAVIFQVSSGKAVKTANWYLHDHKRYVWPLGSGQFLLRRLNSLYIVDSNLKEKLLMTSPKEFLWLTVTPDGKQIIVETADNETTSKKKPDPAKAKKQLVKIEFLDIASLTVQRTIKSEGIVTLEGTSTGFADVSHGMSGKIWLIRFGPTTRQRENIARVRSQCVPDVFYSSSNTLLIGRCSATGSDYSVSSFTVTGHRLWHQRWSEHRYVPKMQRSEDGSRFAVSTLMHVEQTDSAAKPGDEDEDDAAGRGLAQVIQVFDTGGGTSVLSVKISPVVLTAQNISLSPDGRRLAVLNESSLQSYDLPLMSADERSKYSAVKADVPGLYMPSSDTNLQVASNEEEPAYGAAESAPDSAASDQAPDEKTPAAAPNKDSTPVPVAQPVAAADGKDKGVDPSLITFKASSRIVVVDVVITDRKGKPVKGLTQQDFQIAEDGKSQNVAHFEEFNRESDPAVPIQTTPVATSSSTPAGAAPETSAKLPANVYTNNSQERETGSSTMVVLDLLNTPLPDQARTREQLIDFLKKKPEALQMALCSLSTNLRLIQGFTHDENLLISSAKGKKGAVKAPPWQSDSGMERSVQLARDLALVTGDTQSLQRAQNGLDEIKAQDVDVRMHFTLDAFAQLARYLSGVPGRKNLVWLSGSFPLSIFPNPEVTDYQPVTRSYGNEIRKVTNLLAEAHVAVYPVSVKGVETQTMFAASNNGTYDPIPQQAGALGPSTPGATFGLANTSANIPLDTRMQQETRAFRETVASEQGTMEQVAADTGGKAFYNSNSIGDAIETAIDQGSHYYMLSYSPSNKKYDGRFRKIKISLDQKGYHLAYRQGYYADDPSAPVKDTRGPAQDIGVAAMQHGSPQSHQIIFATRVVPIGKPKKADASQAGVAAAQKKNGGSAGPVEMQHYGIDYAIDPAHLLFNPTSAGLYHGVLNFMVTGFDDDEHLVARMVSTATSDLRPANYKDVMTGGFRMHQELDVPVSAVALRLGVEDGLTSHMGTLEIQLPVPIPPDVPRVTARSLPEVEPD